MEEKKKVIKSEEVKIRPLPTKEELQLEEYINSYLV